MLSSCACVSLGTQSFSLRFSFVSPGAKMPTVSIRQTRNEPSAYLYGFLATPYPRRKNPPVRAWLTLSAKRSKTERSSGTALMDALSIVTLTVEDITDADDSGVICCS